MLKPLSAALALALLAGAAQAHEVWVERDGAGPARVYLGEPADVVSPNGDPEFPKLKTPAVFIADPTKPAALIRKADHIEAAVQGKGDVRVQDSNVFEPWQSKDGLTGAAYYARAGRTEIRTVLDLEIAPVVSGGDTFVVVFKGQPAVDTEVTVINPELWTKTFKTDAAGQLTVPVKASGRYLLGVSQSVVAPATLAGKDVAKVVHVSTLTFNQP